MACAAVMTALRRGPRPSLPPPPRAWPDTERHLFIQAIFEILTSEFSYLHSLSILVTEFLQSRELKATMTQTEHHHLFSNILDVLAASQK